MKMISKYSLVSLITAIFSFGYVYCADGNPSPDINGSKALEILISFDSLNGPSKEFFESQVKKVYKKFESVVDFHYVPCSTSHIVDTVLTCCDGTAACQINVLHACAAHKYEGDSKKLGIFFVCMMTSNCEYVKGEGCAKEAGMDWQWLKNCKPGVQAGEFCDNRWKQLNALHEPKIPGVICNRKYDAAFEQQALCDLEGAICAKLKELSVQFDGCPQCSNDDQNQNQNQNQNQDQNQNQNQG